MGSAVVGQWGGVREMRGIEDALTALGVIGLSSGFDFLTACELLLESERGLALGGVDGLRFVHGGR